MSKAAEAHDKVTEVLGLLNVLYDATQANGIHDCHVSTHYAPFVRVVIAEVETMDKLLSEHLSDLARGVAA